MLFYERLLNRTKYLKVWISYTKFEASTSIEDEEVDGMVPDTVFLYESIICSIQYRTSIKQYFNMIKQYFIMVN